MYIDNLFNLKDKIAAITGGGGHLCGEMAKTLARAGCKVVILDLRLEIKCSFGWILRFRCIYF